MTKQPKLVTRESMQALLDKAQAKRTQCNVADVIGRALVHILNRQTEAEAKNNVTRVHNNRGFTPADAKSGCITAKFYIKHKRLEDWQIDRWMTPGKSGFSRVTKYWKQLNEVAVAKQGSHI